MIFVGRSARTIGLLVGLLGLSACASVKVAVPGFSNDSDSTEVVEHSERLALQEATMAFAKQPWGEVEDSGMMSVLFGNTRSSQMDDLLDEYLSSAALGAEASLNVVMEDMHTSLANARHVAEAGRQAAVSITPVPSDITMLEAAIGQARECREMYVRALKALDRDGANVSRKAVRDVRDAFTQTIADIGKTADLVAERVDAGEGQNRFASPNISTTAVE